MAILTVVNLDVLVDENGEPLTDEFIPTPPELGHYMCRAVGRP
jgi:hypothetical protein